MDKAKTRDKSQVLPSLNSHTQATPPTSTAAAAGWWPETRCFVVAIRIDRSTTFGVLLSYAREERDGDFTLSWLRGVWGEVNVRTVRFSVLNPTSRTGSRTRQTVGPWGVAGQFSQVTKWQEWWSRMPSSLARPMLASALSLFCSFSHYRGAVRV